MPAQAEAATPTTTRRPSEYVGTVGQELELEGYVNWIGPDLESAYARKDGSPQFRNRYLINAGGDTVTAFANHLPRVQKGDRIKFTATVKELKTYNDEKQTEVTKVHLVAVTQEARV